MKIHDTELAVADGTGACIFGSTGKCYNEAHHREMTFPEQVQADIDNLREGASTSRLVVLRPDAAARLASHLTELLADCTALEQRSTKLEAAATKLRAAQRAYMAARADRGGKNRVYNDELNALGRSVAEAALDVDAVLKLFAAEEARETLAV